MSDEIRDRVASMCRHLDIPLVGFASAGQWDNPPFEPWVPAEFRPKAIYPETRTVIVIGLPVSLPILETAPSIHYHELYRTVNSLLDMHGYRIAEALTRLGHPSIWIPRDGYGSIGILKERPVAFFSHRHAAYLAGLGTFGINNMLLTPEFGPRVRFASIFTSAEITPDPIRQDNLCTRCMQCVNACPVKALEGHDYPESLTEKKTCAARSEALNNRFISPCGLCIKVCPVGEDRKRFGREDMAMYHEDDTRFSAYHQAWKHVRSYGGR
ncbi:4Fe-4S binding protein [Methanoregula sp.]|uniref:4Fe-4S binding protein n=1 Tax=Methanoregula sp. TaxID=2052170 RepID=UPI00356591B3